MSSALAIRNLVNGNLAVTGKATLTADSISLGNQAGDAVNFGSVSFTSPGAVSIAEDSATNLSGVNTAASLVLNSKGAIDDGLDASLVVAGATALTANDGTTGQAVTLDNAANDFVGTVTVTAGATSLRDTNALTAVLATTGDTTLQSSSALSVCSNMARTACGA